MFDTTPVYAPFDLDEDADNPYADVPERFVAESDPEFDHAWGDYAEATYDPDGGLYDLYEDAGFEEALFGDC
jgi:hypothetical protein